MKRKFFAFFLFYLSVFALVGCDLLSTLDTGILSSYTTTATDSTTEETTTGTTATTVTTSTTASTATTATTVTTSSTTTTTDTDIEYTVTFFDEDGVSVLLVVTVAHGEAAEAPDAPEKLGYEFIGWSVNFDSITANLDVYAVYEMVFDHQLLVDFLVTRFQMNPDYPQNIEDTIDMMLLLAEIESESVLYEMMVSGEDLLGQLQDIASLTDLQTWFLSLSTEGFDEQQIIDLLINLLVFRVDQSIADADPQIYLSQIALLEEQIVQNGLAMNALDAAAADYCLSVPIYFLECSEFYQSNMVSLNWEDDYYDMLAQARLNTWYNWDFVSTLEYRLWDYVWNENDLAYADYLLMLDTQEEPAKSMYSDLGMIYLTWQRNQKYGEEPLRAILYAVVDIENPTHSVAEVLFEQFINPFRWYYYDSQSALMLIGELEMDMQKRQEELRVLVEVEAYLHSIEGISRIKLVLMSLYDILNDVVLNSDPAFFDLLYGFASGETDPSMIQWTPEVIHGYLQHAVAFIDVIELSFDDTDMANLRILLGDVIGIYVASLDLPELEAAGLVTEYNDILDYYLTALDEIYTMLDAFLTNLTPEQIGIVMDILPQLIKGGNGEIQPTLGLSRQEPDPVTNPKPGFGSEAQLVQAVATLIHVLCTDAGFDPSLIVGYALDVYFLTQYGPSGADPLMIADIKAAILGNMDQLILLADQIVTFDLETMTPEQYAIGYEFFQRIQYFTTLFQFGPEGIELEPVFGITEADFIALVQTFIRPMSQEELDAAVAMMLGIFDLPMEETYFTILSFMPIMMEMQTINSYESFLLFYESLPGRGFSNDMIANYLVNFLVGMVDFQIIRENNKFAEYVSFLEQALLDSGDQIDYFEQKIAAQFAAFELSIGTLTPDDQAKIRAYIEVYSLLLEADFARQAAENLVQNDPINYYLLWEYQYANLEWQLRSMYMFPENLEYYTGLYADALAALPLEVRILFQPILDAATVYFEYLYVDLPAAELDCLLMLNTSFYFEVQSYLNYDYFYDSRMLESAYQQFAMYNEQWANAQAPNTSALLAIQTFFNEPESVQLTKDVVLILLDEAGYYITHIDPTTIALIQSLIQATNPSFVLDTTAAGILGYVDRLSDILDMLGMTVSNDDQDKLELFAAKVLWIALEQFGMTPEELAVHFPVYEAAIQELFFKADNVILILNAFLDSLTEVKIQTIIDQITILSSIPADEFILPEQVNYYNFLRAIAIANIVQALAGDGSLDTDTLIAYSIQGYFDYEYLFEYSGPVDELALIAEKQALVDAIILQCGIIDEYLPTTINPLEIGEIDELRILIEQVIFFLQTGPEYLPE